MQVAQNQKLRHRPLVKALGLLGGTLVLGLSSVALAHTQAAAAKGKDAAGQIVSRSDQAVQADFDLVTTQVTTDGAVATFRMAVSGKAGATRPEKTGKLPGARVFAYVWPTSLDPAVVGFEAKSGILAFAVTVHPDFNDTPLFDNDGSAWHSHWVVLAPDEACGPKGLKVKDIPAGAKPKLPKTWPGLPLFIDSPGYVPRFDAASVTVRVPFDDVTALKGAKFDGVTSGLRVNANLHAPFLCIENVFKIASGDLSLPGQVE